MGGGRGGMMGGGGQWKNDMELPTDENGEITMPENFDPSQMQGGGHGGQRPDNMELPTDENGQVTMPEDFDPSQMRGNHGKMPDDTNLPDENI